MGVSGNSVRDRSRKADSQTRGASQPAETLDTDDRPKSSNKKGRIEAELAKRNMEVSSDAWKAFQVYQQYDDWSSETEKTDYTYSRLSSHHNKEIIPGFPVRPNLSRSPIKASSPSCPYDYTSELKELQALRNNLRPRSNRNNTTSSSKTSKNDNSYDTVDRLNYVEEISLYHRIRLFVVSIWTTVVYKSSAIAGSSGAFVQNGSANFASVFVAIWSSFAGFVRRGSSTLVQMWRNMFRSEELDSQGESERKWFHSSTVMLWIRETSTTISTKITTYSHDAYVMASSTSRRKYLLFALLPLLLVAGSFLLYYYSMNPVSIVLSLLVYTYNAILATPHFIYSFTTINIPIFFTESIPHCFLKSLPKFISSIPGFFVVTLPNSLWVAFDWVSFYGAAFPGLLLSLVNTLASYIIWPVSVVSLFDPVSYIQVTYSSFISFFASIATSVYVIYAWVGGKILLVTSILNSGCLFVATTIVDGLSYLFYFPDLSYFNEPETEKAEIIPDVQLDIPLI